MKSIALNKQQNEQEISPLFNQFGKGSRKIKVTSRNCVIYTRVSTKEQADNNMSLETQRKACEQYAAKQGYRIMGCFGGTYESAKTDERKQFNAMLSFVRKSKEEVSAIIVYSVDRFSRSGANAIYITEQLKKQGVVVCAVTQPTDATTASGSLQQNIQFIFSEYDNQLRREKCMAGMKEKLLSGDWMNLPPVGYDMVRRDGKKEIVLNAKGKLIRKAFNWRAQGMSNEDVRLKLAAVGWKLSSQRISDMLRNPFYCGLIVHNALEGKVIAGKQEKAVSKELFLLVNGLLAKNSYGYSHKPENEEVPLKKFVLCAGCNKPLTGYKAKKNQQFYYKCSTVGCNCNRRASEMHKEFKKLIGPYCIKTDDIMQQVIERQMIETYHKLNIDKATAKEEIGRSLAELKKKIERLEERYILEEIDREMFAKFNEKFLSEKKELELEMAKTGNTLSNLKSCVEKCFDYATKLAPLWDSGDYGEKQRLQYMLFPDGIAYERQNDAYRTGRVNSVFSYMASLVRVLEEKKSGKSNRVIEFPAWVEDSGFEPLTSCMPCKRSTN